jgi:hypothetical protein
MTSQYKKLIELYGHYSISDIQNDVTQIYTKSFSEETIKNDKGFADLKKEIEDLAALAEQNVWSTHLPFEVDQLTGAWKFMLNLILFEYRALEPLQINSKIRIIKDLMIQRYPQWTPDLVQYLETKIPDIVGSNYLFISYTNRDAKLINAKYRDLIADVIKTYNFDKPVTEKDWEEKNLLALALCRTLTERFNIPANRIFYDRDDLQTGDVLDKILPICGSSLQFLQLISNQLFIYSEKNWTFEEYKAYSNKPGQPKKLMFTVAGEKHPTMPPIAYPGYKKWFNDAAEARLYKLIPAERLAFEEMAEGLVLNMREYLFNDIFTPPVN